MTTGYPKNHHTSLLVPTALFVSIGFLAVTGAVFNQNKANFILISDSCITLTSRCESLVLQNKEKYDEYYNYLKQLRLCFNKNIHQVNPSEEDNLRETKRFCNISASATSSATKQIKILMKSAGEISQEIRLVESSLVKFRNINGIIFDSYSFFAGGYLGHASGVGSPTIQSRKIAITVSAFLGAGLSKLTRFCFSYQLKAMLITLKKLKAVMRSLKKKLLIINEMAEQFNIQVEYLESLAIKAIEQESQPYANIRNKKSIVAVYLTDLYSDLCSSRMQFEILAQDITRGLILENVSNDLYTF